MGLAIGLSSNSYKTSSRVEEYSLETGIDKKVVDTKPNPNPYRFEIRWKSLQNGNTVLCVHYPDCTTFGGMKLLVLRGDWTEVKIEKLDPHFFADDGHPIVARFKPDEEGMRLAKQCAHAIGTENKISSRVKVCENCNRAVDIDNNVGHGQYCDFTYGRRGWRQLGAYDG